MSEPDATSELAETTELAATSGGHRRALVVTASNRAAAGVYTDRGGPLLADGLRELGFAVDGPVVVRDGGPVEAALREAVSLGYDVVLTTGGTGLSSSDTTPEATRRVIDKEVPGIAEAIRARGTAAGVGTAALSRGVAGLAGRTLIVNVAGSTGACRDALGVLGGVLTHAVEQIHGADHPSAGSGPTAISGAGPFSGVGP